jgi:predicted dehydrogenase
MSARVLLVGYGRRGRDWRAAVAKRRGSSVVAIVDPDERQRAAAETEGLRAWEALEPALTAAVADATVIATPPALHAAQAIACLGAGMDVLVEKPLALSRQEAGAVAAAGDAAGRRALAVHNFRHRPLERSLRGALEAGKIGALRVAAVTTARPTSAPRYHHPEHYPLWELAVHHFDLLRLRFGGSPDVIDARVAHPAGGVTYSVRLDWERGAAADYWLREGGSVYHHAEWLEGTAGALRAVDGRAWLVTPTRRPRRLRAPRAPQPERVLLDALLGGDPSGMDARDALGTIATLEAVTRSLAMERPVRLAELDRDSTGAATSTR